MTNLETNPFESQSKMKLIILGLMSLFMTPLMPLLMVSAIPLIIAHFTFGRKLAFLTNGICLAGLFVFSYFSLNGELGLFLSYVFTSIVATFIAEFLKKGFHPKKIFLLGGLLFCTISVSGLMVAKQQFGFSLAGEIQKVQTQSLESIEGDEKVKEQIKEEMGLIIERARFADKHFVAILTSLTIINTWFLLYFILNSFFFISPLSKMSFTEKSLLEIEFPFVFVWGLIATLAAYISAETLGLTPDHMNLVYGLLIIFGGIFFIQGISVVLCALNRFGVFGFMRTLLLVVSVFMFSYFISILGVFEFWVNFRGRFKKKLN